MENSNELISEHHEAEVTTLVGNIPAPHQTNLANDSNFANKLKEMEALLLAEMRIHDDPFRLWDQPDDSLSTGAKN